MEDLSFRLEGIMGYEPCNDVMGETREQVDMRAPGVLISSLGVGMSERCNTSSRY